MRPINVTRGPIRHWPSIGFVGVKDVSLVPVFFKEGQDYTRGRELEDHAQIQQVRCFAYGDPRSWTQSSKMIRRRKIRLT